MPRLTTPRLRIEPLTLAVVVAILRGERAAAEALIGAPLPAAWPGSDLVARAFPYSLEAILAAPEERLWGDSLLLSRDATPRVIGSVIFHGRPGDDGIAEVGYGIEEDSRGLGLATEGTAACVEWALMEAGATAVHATTFPWHDASIRVLTKCGMTHIGERAHEVFGDLLLYERRR